MEYWLDMAAGVMIMYSNDGYPVIYFSQSFNIFISTALTDADKQTTAL